MYLYFVCIFPLATMSVVGHMAKSTEIMKSMQGLVSLPQLQGVCKNMSQEMVKAGIMEEMMDDAFSMVDDEDLETEADAEVDKVLDELTQGVLGGADKLKTRKEQEEVEDRKEDEAMAARLKSLHST